MTNTPDARRNFFHVSLSSQVGFSSQEFSFSKESVASATSSLEFAFKENVIRHKHNIIFLSMVIFPGQEKYQFLLLLKNFVYVWLKTKEGNTGDF